MKYLKIFENFGEKLYVEIEPDDAYDMLTSGNTEDGQRDELNRLDTFNDHEMEEVTDFLLSYQWEIEWDDDRTGFRCGDIDVIKTDDEYFLGLYWEDGSSDDRGGTPKEYWPFEYTSDMASCYKCDQLDGLLNFLKDFIE